MEERFGKVLERKILETANEPLKVVYLPGHCHYLDLPKILHTKR